MSHQAPGGITCITLEITAGQGTHLGYHFAHMRALLDRVRHSDRLRFCFDTQHAFAAGYDLSTAVHVATVQGMVQRVLYIGSSPQKTGLVVE